MFVQKIKDIGQESPDESWRVKRCWSTSYTIRDVRMRLDILNERLRDERHISPVNWLKV
jgi:hypothetical protein